MAKKKSRSLAAKRGWQTRQKNARARDRERERRSLAAKKGWETRKERALSSLLEKAKKKRPKLQSLVPEFKPKVKKKKGKPSLKDIQRENERLKKQLDFVKKLLPKKSRKKPRKVKKVEWEFDIEKLLFNLKMSGTPPEEVFKVFADTFNVTHHQFFDFWFGYLTYHVA